MLGLAVFGAVVSLINKDKTFFLLSALLVTSLRIAGFNFGWDLQWIGWSVDSSFVPAVKNLTLILHLVLAVALFEELFARQLRHTKGAHVLTALHATYALTVGLTFIIPAHGSIVLIWVLGVVTTLVIFASLGNILRKDASKVVVWYALSWVVTGLGMFGEISNALGYAGAVTKVMNSQVAAISSAVIAGIALAAKLEVERAARIAAQN